MEQKLFIEKAAEENCIFDKLNGLADSLPEDIISRYKTLKSGSYTDKAVHTRLSASLTNDNYNEDAIRYFITANLAEIKTNKFSLDDFVMQNNNKLLGVVANYVNRCLVYVKRYFEGKLPVTSIKSSIKNSIEKLYKEVGEKIEQRDFNEALDSIFVFIEKANEYFDENQPWIQVYENRKENEITLYNCIIMIANLSNILEPFMPKSCERIRKILNIKHPKWAYIEAEEIVEVSKLTALFDWMDIDELKDNIKKYRYNRFKGGLS